MMESEARARGRKYMLTEANQWVRRNVIEAPEVGAPEDLAREAFEAGWKRGLEVRRGEIAKHVGEFDDDRPAQPRREHRRIFEFATGDEVDVDRIVAIDANAKAATLHISMMHGAFLRVHFVDDEQRREQLAALRKLRADA